MMAYQGTGTFIDKTPGITSRYTGIPKGERMESETDVPTKIKMLLKEKPNGLTIEDIAKSLPLNRITTAKYLNALLISGQLECQAVGRAKLFRSGSRVPMSQMLSFNSDAIIVMDRERLIREINPQFIAVFGIPEQDVIGKKFDALSSEVDIVRILMPGICQLNGQSFYKNHEIQKGDEMLHFRSKYLPVVFDDGVPGIAVILADVTEHHHIQQKYEKLLHETTIQRESANTPFVSDVSEHNAGNAALATSRVRAHQIVDNLPDLVLEIDTNLKPGYVSPSYQAILGYSPEELMTGGILGLVHPDEQETIISAIREVVNTKEPVRQEHRIRHKNGDYIWLESVGKPMYDATGTCTGGIISSRDISEQVSRMNALQQNFLALTEHAENLLAREQEVQSNNLELVSQRDALHRYEELFHAIFDYADDAVFLVHVNPDGTPGKYIDVNEAACQYLGYSRTELQGMPVGDHLSHTSRSTILPLIAGRIHEPSHGWFDASYTRNDGTVIPVDASVHIIPHGAEKIAMVAVRER